MSHNMYLEVIETEENQESATFAQEIKKEEGTLVDDRFICQEYVDEHCTICDHCGETIWANDAVADNGSEKKLCKCNND